jgi:excisionase family DNA binding protein
MEVHEYRALTPAEVQETCRFGKSTFYKLVQNKELRAIKVGRSTRVLREDLDSFLSRRSTIGARL